MSSGGGGQSQTTSGGIDPEFKPYLQRALQDAETMRQAEAATPSLVRHQAAQCIRCSFHRGGGVSSCSR